MSDDLISRQAAIAFVKSIPYIKVHQNMGELIKEWIEQIPGVQPVQKTGRWITKGKDLHYCSECGWVLLNSMNGERYGMGFDFHRQNPERWEAWIGWQEQLMNYCPNCGAKMESDNNDS